MRLRPIVILMFCFLAGRAQMKVIDSLKQALSSATEDSVKVKLLCSVAWEYRYIQPDTSIALSSKALSIAQKIRSDLAIAYCYNHSGVYYWLKTEYPSALKSYLNALSILERLEKECKIPLKDVRDIKSQVFANLGNLYYNQNNYLKAIEYMRTAYVLFEQSGDKSTIAPLASNLGSIYIDMDKPDSALVFLFRSLKICEEINDAEGKASALANIGNVYFSKAENSEGKETPATIEKDYHEALRYFSDALRISEDLKNNNLCAMLYGNIGVVQMNLKQYPTDCKYRTFWMIFKQLER